MQFANRSAETEHLAVIPRVPRNVCKFRRRASELRNAQGSWQWEQSTTLSLNVESDVPMRRNGEACGTQSACAIERNDQIGWPVMPSGNAGRTFAMP
jgi:hypothetical protein